MTTKDLFTKEAAKAASMTEAQAMANVVGPEFIAGEAALATITVRAAYATFAAVTSKYAVDGRTPEAKRPAGSLTFQQYAEKHYGRSDASIITDWYHLGCGLVLHGIKTDSPLWKGLQGDAHASRKGAVRKVLADPKAKVTAIKAAVKTAGVNPLTGVALPKAAPAKQNGRNAGGTGNTPPATPPVSTAGVLKDTETLLSQATGAMAKASPTTRQKYRDMLAANLAKVDGIIAADKGTPRSTGGTGISVPTPASVAAKAAKIAS